MPKDLITAMCWIRNIALGIALLIVAWKAISCCLHACGGLFPPDLVPHPMPPWEDPRNDPKPGTPEMA